MTTHGVAFAIEEALYLGEPEPQCDKCGSLGDCECHIDPDEAYERLRDMDDDEGAWT